MMYMSKEEGRVLAGQLEQTYASAQMTVSQELSRLRSRANARQEKLEMMRRQLEAMEAEAADDTRTLDALERLPAAQEFLGDLETACFAITTAAGRDIGHYAEMKRFYEDLRTVASGLAESLAASRQANLRAQNAVEELNDRNIAVGKRLYAFLTNQR